MTIPHRGQTGSGTYFITFNIDQRRRLLQSDRSAGLLLELMYELRSKRKLLVHAFVVMPDHFHALITPLRPVTLERCVGQMKGAFSFRYPRLTNYRGEIWQPSFMDRRVRDREEYARFRAYIHNNPVRAGLCERPEDFPFSSANGRFELDEAPQRLKPLAISAAGPQA